VTAARARRARVAAAQRGPRVAREVDVLGRDRGADGPQARQLARLELAEAVEVRPAGNVPMQISSTRVGKSGSPARIWISWSWS
jgi:hypothetical protein